MVIDDKNSLQDNYRIIVLISISNARSFRALRRTLLLTRRRALKKETASPRMGRKHRRQPDLILGKAQENEETFCVEDIADDDIDQPESKIFIPVR